MTIGANLTCVAGFPFNVAESSKDFSDLPGACRTAEPFSGSAPGEG